MCDDLQHTCAGCNDIPLIFYHEQRAKDAFSAYSALCVMQAFQPSLLENPAWIDLRCDAFENFNLAFERMS